VKAVAFAQSGRLVEVNTSDNVLKALLAEQVPVKMACGGRGLCATCHVYVDRGGEGLTPCTKREKRTLGLLGESTNHSRLACQARVLKDGVVVRLPEGLFVEEVADLEALVGRRAEDRLLHPVDGRILVPVGKIITRSTVERLRSVEVDLQKIMADTRDA